MTKRLLERTVTHLSTDPFPPLRRFFCTAAAGCAATFLVGCGAGDSTTSTTSNEDIAAFIEENPEYGDSAAAAGKPSKSTKPAPLGLER